MSEIPEFDERAIRELAHSIVHEALVVNKVHPATFNTAMLWANTIMLAMSQDTLTGALDMLRKQYVIAEQVMRAEFGRIRYP